MNRRQGRRLREWTKRGEQRSVSVLGPEGDGYGGGGETELKEEEVWPRFVFFCFTPFRLIGRTSLSSPPTASSHLPHPFHSTKLIPPRNQPPTSSKANAANSTSKTER